MTVPLPFRLGSTRSRRNRTATRMVAVAAAVSAALGVMAAANPDARPGSADKTDQTSGAVAFTAFTPREAQMPQTVPEPVIWEQNRIAAEAARPRTVRPIEGVLTSNFGMRWGALHAGLDFADAIGTPIAAVTDGTVIEAGPASGFGLWVRVQQDDGTIGIYGHVNDILATVGQPVRAGDVIATVGNRGFSTGPHLHYESTWPTARRSIRCPGSARAVSPSASPRSKRARRHRPLGHRGIRDSMRGWRMHPVVDF